MATNLNIDQELLNTALTVGGLKTKRATVNQALQEFILRRRQKEIKSLFNNIVYDEDYDYKKLRHRK